MLFQKCIHFAFETGEVLWVNVSDSEVPVGVVVDSSFVFEFTNQCVGNLKIKRCSTGEVPGLGSTVAGFSFHVREISIKIKFSLEACFFLDYP